MTMTVTIYMHMLEGIDVTHTHMPSTVTSIMLRLLQELPNTSTLSCASCVQLQAVHNSAGCMCFADDRHI